MRCSNLHEHFVRAPPPNEALVFLTYFFLLIKSSTVAGPGLGKVLPAHPIHEEMVSGMAQLMGPFYGIKGDILRNFLGFPYIS